MQCRLALQTFHWSTLCHTVEYNCIASRYRNSQVTASLYTQRVSIFSLFHGWQMVEPLQQPENARANVSLKARPTALLSPPGVPAQPRLNPPWPCTLSTPLSHKQQYHCPRTTTCLLRSHSLLLGLTRNTNWTLQPCFLMMQAMLSPNPGSAGIQRRSEAEAWTQAQAQGCAKERETSEEYVISVSFIPRQHRSTRLEKKTPV
jgi:hypothetical protein